MLRPSGFYNGCLCFCLLTLASAACAHPAHETNAEMIWNAKTKSLEVALQIRGVDLEAALTKKGEKKVDLEATRDIDALIDDYISDAFRLRTQGGQRVRLEFAGKTIEARTVWLYFEFPLGTDSPFGVSITNRLLFGTLVNQTNKVALQVGEKKLSFTFDERHPTLKLSGSPSPKRNVWKPPRDFESLPSISELPDLFTMSDGTRVTSVDHWRQRRIEMQQIIQYFAYGRLPPRPEAVKAAVTENKVVKGNPRFTRELARLSIVGKPTVSLDISIHLPQSNQRCPVIVLPVHRITELSCLPSVLEHGYALVQFERDDLDPDKPNIVGSAQATFPDYDWGTLAVWAWGAMRVADYIESRQDLDKERIILTGHSRDGKVALLAGALDERFALVAPNGSGCGGAGCFRDTPSNAESLEKITDPKRFAYWFHPNLRWFAGREQRLPFDQHFLKALIAPRPLLCTESEDDLWANPQGTRRTNIAARDAYSFLEAKEKIGVRFRNGPHDHMLEDWKALLDFADRHLADKVTKRSD